MKKSDSLRTSKTYSLPDPRYRQGIKVEQFIELLQKLSFNSRVPKEVQTQFETTKNLFLYSYSCYRFTVVAQNHAYSVLEYSLKQRLKKEGISLTGNKNSLKGCIKYAIQERWITDETIDKSAFQDLDPEDDQCICKRLLDHIPYFRNNLSHGSTHLNTPSWAYLEIKNVHNLIAQLFN